MDENSTTHIMFYDQVLSEAFVPAFFLGEMRRFWGQEPLWVHAPHTLFYGVLLILSAAFSVKVFFWVYLDALWHVMRAATEGH